MNLKNNIKNKINVFFNEYNLLMGSGGVTYLPLVSGILSANAKKNAKIRNNFKFKKFIFHPETPENIIKNYYKDFPDIAVFSVAMWNEQLCLKVAKILKKKFNTLIIFGGASCPHFPTEYFKKYPFIDVTIRAEGEDSFNEILLRYLEDKNDFSKIPNVAFRDKKNKKCLINYEKFGFIKDLDIYPSPYLTGEFDYLVSGKKEHNYQAIIETNRGCPFLCTYCYWGKGGNTTKYRFHSLGRVFDEIDWVSKNKIKYLFNADSNFGMHRRDIQIAEKLIENKIKTGYPEKFRTCWGKNTSEQIFKIGNMLHIHDLEKGITLARQTNSKEALKNVKRDNIKLDTYSELEKKFNNLKIPIYADMIMGLPGETYQSWIDGLGSLLQTSINNQIFVYQAEVYPNTELNEEAYKKKFKIKTKKIELLETHCSPKEQKWLKEYQEIVIGTISMPTKDWKKSNLFSVVLMVMHSFKLGFYILNYLSKEIQVSGKDFVKFICDNANKKDYPFIYKNIILNANRWINNLLNGKGRGVLNTKYSDVYLEIEEIIFLDVSQNFKIFYKELKKIVKNLVGKKKWNENCEVINEIFMYQNLRMPRINTDNRQLNFKYNIAEYLFYLNSSNKNIKLKKQSNSIKVINTKNYGDDYREFTKKKIIWARKNDKIKNDIDYDSKILEEMKKAQENEIDKENFEKKYKINLFDKINKFKKYDSLEIKNNRKIYNS
jgi:putative methyltransferase